MRVDDDEGVGGPYKMLEVTLAKPSWVCGFIPWMGINYRKVSTGVRWKAILSSSEKWAPSSLDRFIGLCMSGWLQILPEVLIIGCCLAGRGVFWRVVVVRGCRYCAPSVARDRAVNVFFCQLEVQVQLGSSHHGVSWNFS